MSHEFGRLGVDPCGERGEYHTVVTNSRLFSEPLALREAGHAQHSGCWALDLEVVDASGA
jgi:diphthamide synthase (EF-2-diphthine--ammonia ligase)